MDNALAPAMRKPGLMAGGLQTPEYLSPTAPAPDPAAPRAMPNALSAPNAYMGAPKKPQNEMLGAAVRGFQRGFDPAGFEQQRAQGKADGLEKQKQTLALMQQQRQLPEEQRTQWWQQNAGTIGQIIGQDISQQQVDPAQFSDQALDGQIAALSGQLGIAPATPEPMSAYQREQVRLEELKMQQPRNQFIQGPDGAIAVGNLNDGTIKTLQPGQPKPDPANYDMVTTADGVIAVNKRDPSDKIRIGAAPPRASAGDGVGFRSLTPDQVAQRGYPAGTVVQVDSRGKEYVNSRPSTQQTGQPTESERSAGLHATVSINGLRNIMAREAGGYNRAGVMEQAGGVFGGENERLYDQAADEFIDGYLRAMTGAAATKNEIDTYKRQWFPALGDTPAVIAQKSAGRLNALKGMKSKAGRAWNPEWDGMITELEGEAVGGPGQPKGGGPLIDPLQATGNAMGQSIQDAMRQALTRDNGQNDDESFIDSLFPADDGASDQIPEGITPEEWNVMPPEDRALFQ